MAKKKAKLTKKQLEILYECWKDGENTKEWIALIEERLPKVPSLAALSVLRRMAKTDTKWLKMATRKKNQKEKEKADKQKEKERKKIEAEKKKVERERKRKERTQRETQKQRLEKIKENLKISYLPALEEKIEPEYFFCQDVHQYVHNLSCIFRIFSNEFNVLLASECEKCSKMNKFISIIEEIIKDGRQEKTRKHTPSKSGGKNEKSSAKRTPKKTRGSKSNK